MKKNNYFSFYFVLSALEAFGAVLWLLFLPAETANALAFGFSAPRLLLIGVLTVISLICLALAFSYNKKTKFAETIHSIFSTKWLLITSLLILLTTWIMVFLPVYQWGSLGGYKSRLLPLILFLLIAGIQTLLLGIVFRKKNNFRSISNVLKEHSGFLRRWAVFLGFLTAIIFVIAIFRIGLVPDIVYWNDINVPLLGIQIIGTVTFSIILSMVLSRTDFFAGESLTGFRRYLPDVVIFILIWSVAAVAWTQTSGPHSFFSPGPYPPNGEYYPFSDAAGYDLSAQNAVIGEGLGTQTYVDKPLYVGFLALIHLIVGSQMNMVVGLQVAVIALLPAIIYLLGNKIHSRLAGIIAAGFVIFREINNINGTLWVLSSNTKVLMTESLVSLLLALSVFFFTAWVKQTGQNRFLMAAGGSLGLAGLIRLNPFFLLPIVLVSIFLLMWRRWKQAFINCGIFVIFFAAAVLPWMIQSYIVHGNFIFFTSTVRWVVLPQRTFYALNKPTVTPENVETTPQTLVTGNRTLDRIIGVSKYVSAHFMHNMISSMAIFPLELDLNSLEKTIKSPGSYWSPEWSGDLSPGKIILLWIITAILALGLTASWTRNRWAGLMPVGFLMAYSLVTAAARTSGGRYILPADWVEMFYFSVGISQAYSWITDWWAGRKPESPVVSSDKNTLDNLSGFQTILLFLVFTLIGAIPVILDRSIPKRYETMEKSLFVEEIEKKNLLESLQITAPGLKTFLENPQAVVFRGRGLYPRYYGINDGEPDKYSEARSLPYPRLVMTVIGSQTKIKGILPLSRPPESLPNGSDVLTIGCAGELNDDWLAIVVEGQQDQVILRNPSTEWDCPVKTPECDDNRNCR
jgi:hypothetical protein